MYSRRRGQGRPEEPPCDVAKLMRRPEAESWGPKRNLIGLPRGVQLTSAKINCSGLLLRFWTKQDMMGFLVEWVVFENRCGAEVAEEMPQFPTSHNFRSTQGFDFGSTSSLT